MLQKIFIKQTELTPLVYFDNEKSVFKIKGILVPEDAYSFFIPIFNWMDNYQKKATKNFKFEFELLYFNTTSSMLLLDLMKIINEIPNQKIVWLIDLEDEDMIEVANDYNDILAGEIEVILIDKNIIV